MSSNTAHAAPLTGATTAIPATAATLVVLAAPLAGALSINAPNGWGGGPTWSLPAGTPAGVYRAPFGASSSIATLTLSNPADAASGSFVACAAGTPVPGPFPAGAYFAQPDAVWPWWGGAAGAELGRVQASFLASKSGGLGLSFATGVIAIRKALIGVLTLASPGGYSQVLPAGSVGVIALTGPTGPGCTFALSHPDDQGEANTILAVGALA